MQSMNLLDITIKYFNVIVFVLCVLFGMISFFASWIAWREIHHKRNIIRSVIAAYNITEDTLAKGTTADGDFRLDPTIVQTILNSLQEILNAVYGEATGKPIPPREERAHGKGRSQGLQAIKKALNRKEPAEHMNIETEVPVLLPEEREDRPDAYSP
ncbi:hypothetical protein ACFL2Q_13020 [Thermodesulfobacteriota bacterium]